MLRWRFFLTSSVGNQDKFVLNYGERLSDVTTDGFGDGRRLLIDAEGANLIFKFLDRSDIGGFLQNEQGETSGFIFITMPEEKLFGKSMVWIDNICLCSGVQNRGYGSFKRILADLQKEYPEKLFGWAGCQTQHFGMMNSLFRASRSGDIFPFHPTYETDSGKMVQAFLVRNVVQVAQSRMENSGIYRGVYYGRRLGKDNSRAGLEIEDYLASNSFSRENGDAVIMLARV